MRFLLPVLLSTSGLSAAADGLTFEKDIRPILKVHCFHCHGEENVTKSGLDVRLARYITKGGESGPAIVPRDSAKSLLLDMVKKGEMPKGKAKLSDGDIDKIERWIAAGAPTARPEPDKLGPEHAFTDEERQWWSIQPIKRPQVPVVKDERVKGAVDAFIVARLPKELSLSPETTAAKLIRRITLDLTGLPPTPEETAGFEKAHTLSSDAAVRALVDRLLESPAYGERWGRQWLDVVGYADSDGYTATDPLRQWAWKYRDYVIRSFNQDKPWDQFIQEQLAGDELVPLPHQDLSADAIEKLTATGFLRMAPDGTGAGNDKVAQNACVADTIKIVGTALYGLTIGCAQCHDHRYDPISQADYYRLRAVFEPGFDLTAWRVPANRHISLLTTAQKVESAKIEEEAKLLDAARLKQQEAFITEVLEKELLKAPENLREPLRTAYRTVVAKRTAEQTKLLKDYPRVNQLSGSSLYLYDTTYQTAHAKTLEKMAADAAAVRARKPVQEFIQAFAELPKAKPELIPATFVFHRGEPDQPKDKVPPSDLSVLAGWREVNVPASRAAGSTSGRRLAFAHALTDGKHPLLARVLVNRFWMHHFGRGLVSSAGDFGRLGTEPSHPELLDWLASEFMASGWKLKQLHRTLLTSSVYRQASSRDPLRDRVDPDNVFLSRMNVRRLEAESLRDAMLSTSGKLIVHSGGKPVPVMLNTEGQAVLGIDTTDTAGRPSGKFISMEGQDFRRSIYVQNRRTRPLEMFNTFDAPSMMEANCETRPVTTVSPQSLLLMNNGYMREYAGYFASRVRAEQPTDIAKQAERAIQLAYSRSASMAEVQAAAQFVQDQTAHYRAHPAPLEVVVGPTSKTPPPAAAPELLGLAALCHALMSANEFLYID
jgi:hypothetical protein